jgi:hypothetical protein
MVKGKSMIGVGVLLVGFFCLANMSYADAPTWEPDIRLSNDSDRAYLPAITSDANGLHVVWFDERDGNCEIYYKCSTDFGNTWWGPDVRLTNDASYSGWPAITSDANGLHVVWYDERDGNAEIYYKHSSDFGTTWNADVRLTNDASYSYCSCSAITSAANGLHVVWQDNRDGNWEIYYKHSPDFGNTWEPDVRLTNDSSRSGPPVITSDANGLHVVWYDERDGNREIYYKRSTDFGNTWEPDVRLTNATNRSDFPAITSDANGLHVVWIDNRDGKMEIYYKHSPDFGNTWEPDVRLVSYPRAPWNLAITSDTNGLHVVWEDWGVGREIYYKHSPDFGNTWKRDVRLTNAPDMSGYPAITSDIHGLHVVWYDKRDGFLNSEIYYKRGTFPEVVIDIILNGDSFEPSQTITIDVQADNLCDYTIMTDVRICVKLPNDEYYRIIKLNDFPIPPGTLGPVNLVNYTFTEDDEAGAYEAIGRLLHPDSGETLNEDIEPFEFVNP